MMDLIEDSGLLRQSGVRHGFFTRRGGVSGGVYASLNAGFGSGDDAGHVAENRARAAHALGLGPDRLATAYQVHSSHVVAIDAPTEPLAAPRADGFVTATPGLMLGILTADCAPVLFADGEARVIGAAHAGWRGALAGVLEATVRAMEALGASRARIHAAIGPCIGKESYEVGPEFPAAFLNDAPSARDFFAPAARPGHFLFDLAGYGAMRLKRLGLAAVGVSGGDTCAEADRFFSYRRACLEGEDRYGRGLSGITLVAD